MCSMKMSLLVTMSVWYVQPFFLSMTRLANKLKVGPKSYLIIAGWNSSQQVSLPDDIHWVLISHSVLSVNWTNFMNELKLTFDHALLERSSKSIFVCHIRIHMVPSCRSWYVQSPLVFLPCYKDGVSVKIFPSIDQMP